MSTMMLRPTRRSLLAAGGAAGLTALLAACGTGSGGRADSASGDGSSGSWSFTDDRGSTVRLASRPQRIVAYTGTAAALHDLGVPEDRLVGVFGPTRLADGRPDVQAGSLDVNATTVVGNAYGEFDLEKYASLDPQLLITNMFEPGALWYVPDDSRTKILKLAPAVGISVVKKPLTSVLTRYEKLAGTLGADPAGKSAAAAKSRFRQAAAELRAAAESARRRGVRVLAASASADLLYVSDPAVYPDLSWFSSLGVDVVRPKKVVGGFFENLSWENAGRYPADLILLDSRTSALQPAQLTSKPAWAALPAVKAGQVSPWLSEPIMSYAACAPAVERLAATLRNARKVS
jgi:iron complex transport system substrate-binding protein